MIYGSEDRTRRTARNPQVPADPGESSNSSQQPSCFSSIGTMVAADYRSGITRCHKEHVRRGLGAGDLPARPVPSVRSLVSSVQLTRSLGRNVLMVGRRSTVRFRNGALVKKIIRTPRTDPDRFREPGGSRPGLSLDICWTFLTVGLNSSSRRRAALIATMLLARRDHSSGPGRQAVCRD